MHNSHVHSKSCRFPEWESFLVAVDSQVRSQKNSSGIHCLHFTSFLVSSIFAWQIQYMGQYIRDQSFLSRGFSLKPAMFSYLEPYNKGLENVVAGTSLSLKESECHWNHCTACYLLPNWGYHPLKAFQAKIKVAWKEVVRLLWKGNLKIDSSWKENLSWETFICWSQENPECLFPMPAEILKALQVLMIPVLQKHANSAKYKARLPLPSFQRKGGGTALS